MMMMILMIRKVIKKTLFTFCNSKQTWRNAPKIIIETSKGNVAGFVDVFFFT